MLSKDTVEQMTDGQREIYLAGLEDGKAITKHLLEMIIKSESKNVSGSVYTNEEVISIIRRLK
jgi:hypothetical protein